MAVPTDTLIFSWLASIYSGDWCRYLASYALSWCRSCGLHLESSF